MHKEKIDFIKKNDTMIFTPLLLLPIRNIFGGGGGGGGSKP